MKLKDVDTIEKIQEYIADNLAKEITVQEVADKFNINRIKLQVLFKKLLGYTLHGYILEQRLLQSAEQLINTDNTVSDIAHSVGYQKNRSFLKSFKAKFSISPTQYRTQQRVPPTLSKPGKELLPPITK